jgi:hypothetical protein
VGDSGKEETLLEFARHILGAKQDAAGFVFSRPLVAIQSDDWGRLGVRDREGYENLRSKGVKLGEHPYDLYSLETAEDVGSLAAMLSKHHDSVGRSPCVVTNFCTANLDFKKMKAHGFKHIEVLPLAQEFPGSWSRPGLFEAYRAGIREGVFFPGMHGLTHFCPVSIENALTKGGERAQLLHTFWKAETPYIYWRMPWIGYEYWNPERPHAGFLSAELQTVQIEKARACFSAFFGNLPISACAPGYRANRDTRNAWHKAGIRIVQNGPASGMTAPHIDAAGTLQLSRTIDFEPSQRELEIDKYLQIAGNYFARGLPVIISTHSINFHSTLHDFRTPTLAALDSLLTALELRYPELLYVHDQDIYHIVTEGILHSRNEEIAVSAKREWKPCLAQTGAP